MEREISSSSEQGAGPERLGLSAGVFDWTLSPAKWGAVGVLALLGGAGLSWSVIRGEAWNAREAARSREALAMGSGRETARSPGGPVDADPVAGSPPDSAPMHEPAAPATLVPIGDPEVAEAPAGGQSGGSSSGAPDSTVAQTPAPTAPQATAPTPDPPPEAGVGQRINLNTATEAQLQLLPGIGPSRARAIIEDRAANGPFRSVDELDRVRGIGPGIVAGLREFARVR